MLMYLNHVEDRNMNTNEIKRSEDLYFVDNACMLKFFLIESNSMHVGIFIINFRK